MEPITTLRTARMTAERLRPEHLPLMVLLNADPEVAKTLGGVRSAEQTRLFVEQEIHHWELYGYGLWVLHETASERFIGRAGLRNVPVEGRDEVEIAYALMPAFWGAGFASEIVRVLLGLAFERLGLAEIVAFTLVTNRASVRVMEKAGMKYERDIVHASLPHVLYRARRDGGIG